MTTGISIVLIHWKIKKGREPDFGQDWKTKFVVKNRDGLIGEYLSKVERRDTTYRYISWPIMCDNLAHEEQCTHYINAGIWNSHARFFEEVGQYMKDDKPPVDYEVQRRRRVAITPAEAQRPGAVAAAR